LLPDSRSRSRPPFLGGVKPPRRFRLRSTVFHPELPPGTAEASMVEPAEKNSVVCVSWSPVLGGVYVVDFAPGCGDMAAGGAASAVAERDRPTLLRCEAALG